MTLIIFSVANHIQPLLTGIKCQTTRVPRKNPIKVGDTLQIYFRSRMKKSCKNCIQIEKGNCWSANANLLPCLKHSSYFGDAIVTDIHHHWKVWPENHRELTKGGYYALFGDMPEVALEKWAVADGFTGGLQEAHLWFMKTHKDQQWMFRDWDVVIFDPKWLNIFEANK
jgi:hypothetical protein